MDTPSSRDNPQWIFNYIDARHGYNLNLREGVDAQIFEWTNLMFSFVDLAPHTPALEHSHPEEQWGILLEGQCVRVQYGQEVSMSPGDFWYTPANVPHAIYTTEYSAKVLDVFVPPRHSYSAKLERTGRQFPTVA